MAAAFGLFDGLGAAEAAAVVVFRGLGDAVVLGLGAVVRAVCQDAVALGLCAVVFFALATGVFVALGAADAVPEGSPAGLASQGRPRSASFHQPFLLHETFVVLFPALSDRCPPLPGQSVQAMAADGMPTVPTATAAMTIRR
ncbi:hypothetical protein [Streptomyces sp. NPDC001833]|uniref:hypothetical protein n=1 Tax=Streptomyces sp. NPDC001833 TaxID=3154658 RepID=UPI003323C0E1